MIIARSIKKIREVILPLKQQGITIGFVPTMGALHEGHLSLIKKARIQTQFLVVSIFVNPIQFGPREDFKVYPRRLSRDKKLLRQAGVDLLFYPSASQMYKQDFSTYVEETTLSHVLCGLSRPGHFRGVTTVVAKLFNIVTPDISYFGQKDYQQAQIIKRMVADLNFNIKIKVLPIVRDKDGLALSSRNSYLDKISRQQALCLYRALQRAKALIASGERDAVRIKKNIRLFMRKFSLAKIDYVEIVDAETLREVKVVKKKVVIALAVFIKGVRLIDNMLVDMKKGRFI
ncbi:MAG: pantoate--beta-alanine ligase [Candidatus Omnitrophica bacterium]|nr:pantoate--beta-alanine ligase [Candidatus Omnitrophota bacterium]